jgi:hypothetical protein
MGKIAKPISNKPIDPSLLTTQKDLDKLSHKTYQLTTNEVVFRKYLTIMANTLITAVDQINWRILKYLTEPTSDVTAKLLFHSSYILQMITALSTIHGMYYDIISKTRTNYSFPILPAIIGQDSVLRKQIPDFVYYGFETIHNVDEVLISKPLLKLRILHTELVKLMNHVDLVKNQTLIDQLAQQSNQIQTRIQRAICINGLLPSHPNSRDNMDRYDYHFCDSYRRVKKNNTIKCDRRVRNDYDNNLMIENLYRELNTPLGPLGPTGAPSFPALPPPPNSLNIYASRCSSTNEWERNMNVVNYQLLKSFKF